MGREKYTLRRCALCKKSYCCKTTCFFKAPQCDIKRQRWIDSCNVNIRIQDLICEYHFRAEDFVNGPTERRRVPGKIRLQPGAVPKILKEPCETIKEEDESMHKDCATQTKDDFLQHSFRVEIMLAKEKFDQLEKEYAKLLAESTVLLSSLGKIFTKGQLDKLKNPNKKVMWSSEDIINAEDLLACGIRAYKHIYYKGFPLPHISTMWKSARGKRIKIDEAGLAIDNSTSASDALKVKLPVLNKNNDEIKVQEEASTDNASKTVPSQTNSQKLQNISIQSTNQEKVHEDASLTNIVKVEKEADIPDLSSDDMEFQEYSSHDSSKVATIQNSTAKIQKLPTFGFSQIKVEDNDVNSDNNIVQDVKEPILLANDKKLKVHQDAMASLSTLPKHIKVSILSVDSKNEQHKSVLPLSTFPKHTKSLPVDEKKEQQNEGWQSNLDKFKRMPPILSVEVKEEQQSTTSNSNAGNALSNENTRVQQTSSTDATLLNTSPKQDKVSILYLDVPKKCENASKATTSSRNLMKEIRMPISLDDLMEEAYEYDIFNF